MTTTEKKIFINLKINKKISQENYQNTDFFVYEMRQITPNIGLINLVGH